MAMPEVMHDLNLGANGPENVPFPASSKQASGLVGTIHTEVSSIYFSDKILFTISQEGRLSQWIQVPLSSTSPTAIETALPSMDEDYLPQSHLNPKTLLGGGGEERESVGQLFAVQIANMISMRNPEEVRTVVVGLGFQKIEMVRESFFDVMELLQKVV